MKKLILLGFITLLTFSHAKTVNAIALIVEGEAVTTAEIRAVQQQLQVSKEKATDLLIQDRLQKAAMKNINVSEDAVDGKIAQIAAQNNITVPKMQKVLKERGTTWNKYRSSIKESLKKEKFYKEKVVATITAPSEDELKIFYRNHKEEFVVPATISMIEYSSTSEAVMKKFLQTKKKKGIKSRSVKKSTKDLNPALLGTILQTQDGSYTRPINAGDKYISYKVLSKHGKVNMPFEASKGAVAARWKQQQQGKALKDYFEKMKTNANIQVIRK
ncbi:MAG: peptidyl-prolyl cis-trans isomerase [Campylobacterota bacterium]|nr:peptidyl-prolyl cis-trans isomerase [Campylobacterota bacterium]